MLAIGEAELLLTRECSTMASSWTEHLCLVRESETSWLLGSFSPEWLCPISDVPDDILYDENEEMVIPETWEGKKIVGLGDGEFLETEDLISQYEEVVFGTSEMQKAVSFFHEYGWSNEEGAEQALERIIALTNGTSSDEPEKDISRSRYTKVDESDPVLLTPK